jgi:hypothetical protein
VVVPPETWLQQYGIMKNPECLPPPLRSTPIKHGTSTMFKFTTNQWYCKKEMSAMGEEMKDYFVRPMPATKFLDAFFPSTAQQRSPCGKTYGSGCYDKVVLCGAETLAYDPFVSQFYFSCIELL